MTRMRAGSAGVMLLVMAACRSSKPAPTVADISVEIVCDDEPTRLAVRGDRAIDETLCGAPWEAVQLDMPSRTELVKAMPSRELWLRRAKDRAFVELRVGGKVSATFDHVTSIVPRTSTAAVVNGELAITHDGKTEQLSIRDLKRRYGSATTHVGELPLCRLAVDIAGSAGTIAVFGEQPAPQVFTREQCEQRGLVLKLGAQGDIRLRGASGERLLQRVHRLVVSS